ncbi:hypothetical protein [Methylomonas sp. MgM2]
MKTSAEKSSTTASAATPAAKQAFFAKTGEDSFFGPNKINKDGHTQVNSKTAKTASFSSPPNEVTSLKSGLFSPTPFIAKLIDEERKGASIRASFGSFAQGEIKVRKRKQDYETVGIGQLPLVIPALKPLQDIGVPLVLAIEIRKSAISGYIAVAGKRWPEKKNLARLLHQNTKSLGWTGLQFKSFSDNSVNSISNGVLQFSQNDIPVRLGGFLDSRFALGLSDDRFFFEGGGTAKIPGLQPTAFDLALKPDGKIKGEVNTGVTFKNFSGSLRLRFVNGLVDGQGDVQYSTEKLSGSFHIVLTDQKTARGIAFNVLPPEQLNQKAIEQSGLQSSGTSAEPMPGPRALAGTATLNVVFNEWLSGTALVVVDGAGHVTVVSKITPQKVVTLFRPRQFPSAGPRVLFSANPTFRYGLPYVADVHVGISVVLTVGATIGPGVLRNISVEGTYSTDPLIFNQFALSAELHIQALAELALALEAKAGLTILAHDINAGAGIKGALVLKAYVEGIPTIGYREKADPMQGKKGEFFIKGSAVAAAQPFFVLSGYLFIELDSPWWSPAPDKRWPWSLGEKEYPLGSGWGVGMKIGGNDGYVLGSDKAPDIDFDDAQFDGSKFIDNVVDDNVPKEQGRSKESKNPYSDQLKGQAPPPTAKPSVSIPSKTSKAKPPANAKLTEKWMQASTKGLLPLKQKAEKTPFDEIKLTRELNRLRTRFGFTALQATQSGNNWLVVAEMFDRNNKLNPLALKGAPTRDGKGGDKPIKGEAAQNEEGLPDRVKTGLLALEQVTQGYLKQGATEDELQTAIKSVRRKFSFKSIQLIKQQGFWHYLYEINPKGDLKGPKVREDGNAADWPTGSGQNPIPIKWFKPRDNFYPTLRLRGGAERTPRQGIKLPAVGRRPERLLKVSDANFMQVDQKIGRTDRGSEAEKQKIREHIEALRDLGPNNENYIVFDGAGSYAIDHVRDLTWQGGDNFENLWPLASDKNNAINASHNQQVRVNDNGTVLTKAAYLFSDKKFIIKKIATTAPSSSSDHGSTKDSPINSGEHGIPKKAI